MSETRAYFAALGFTGLNDKEIVAYLDSLADLYRCLERSIEQGFGSAAGRPGRRPQAKRAA